MEKTVPTRPQPPTSRDKILDVAEALFARSGFSGVGMREVADGSGLGKSSLFHHFPSKLQLHDEVLGRVIDRIGDNLAPPLAGSGGHAARLEAASDALVDTLAEHETYARLLLRALFEHNPLEDEVTAEGERAEARLMEIVAAVQRVLTEGIAAGEFRPVSVPDALQTFIGAVVFHFASGEFGERLHGASLFSSESVSRRKRELRAFLHNALAADPRAETAEE